MAALMPWLVSVAIVTAPADSQPRAITLDEAVAMAEHNAPIVIQALGQEHISAAGVRAAQAAFIPSLSLDAGSVRQTAGGGGRTQIVNGQVVTLPSQPWAANFGFTATLDLFEGGLRIFNLRQAHGRQNSARANQLVQRYAAILSAKQQFFNIQAARETRAAALAQLDQAEQQLVASRERVKAKNVTRSDSLRALIQVQTANQAVLDANTSLDFANASLTRAVGSMVPVTAAEGPEPPDTPIALADTTLMRLADHGPAVAGAEADLASATAAREAAWTAYLPTISLSYSRSGSGEGPDPWPGGEAFGYNGTLRLGVSFPVFNQLQRELQLTTARAEEQNAIAALRDAQLAVRANLAQSLGAYRSALQRIDSGNTTLEAAEEDLRMQRDRYSLGVATQLDVLTSQTELDSARRDLIRARYDARVALAEIEALTGHDL